MKKLFLVVLAAGLFVACGNQTNNEATPDSTDVVVEQVEEATPEVAAEPAVDDNAPVAEAEPTTAQKIAKAVETGDAQDAAKAADAVANDVTTVTTSSRRNR